MAMVFAFAAILLGNFEYDTKVRLEFIQLTDKNAQVEEETKAYTYRLTTTDGQELTGVCKMSIEKPDCKVHVPWSPGPDRGE